MFVDYFQKYLWDLFFHEDGIFTNFISNIQSPIIAVKNN